MAHASDLIATDIERYLEQHQHKELLRFITCGSVDDGKSTLIGRLLYESKLLFDDHLAAVERDSHKWGTQGDRIDFALLVDGLAAEREQGITIDVAYRFFSTDKRKFIVADTPGHEQYTRNMVTGASTADCAVLMVDARKGVLVQTRRHSYLVDLLGIRHVLVAVNKMDLVGYAQTVFDDIARDYRRFAEKLGFESVTFVPLSAFEGDNVLEPSTNMGWWRGTTLMRWLETVPVDNERMRAAPMRLPVQWVNRPNLDFRGFAGTLTSGTVAPGDAVRIQPSGRETVVSRIVTHDGDLPLAVAGQAVTLVLRDEVDASRGDMISAATAPAEVADQFECTLVWMDDEPLLPGRPYLLKIGALTASATVTDIVHEVDVNTLHEAPARRLALNAIAVCRLSLDRAIPFDEYTANRETGGFVLIDRLSNRTAGAGMIRSALRKASDIHVQAYDVDKAWRASMKHQKPCVLWFTGLSGSGKSTIANLVERKLAARGQHTYILDGDNVRHGLNRDLGFSPEDRVENLRRVAEVAKLMVDAGLIVITAFISPYRADRDAARALFAPGEFLEVFVDAPLAVAEGRDPKGLYKRARAGQLKSFTGVDAPYEVPSASEVRIDSENTSIEAAADQVIAALEAAR
jgi:bifunctional enzyme CysN/CysC